MVKISTVKGLAWYRSAKTDNEAFWEEHWKNQINVNMYESIKKDSLGTIGTIMKKHFPLAGLILEGGCGRGEIVYWLTLNGYNAVGVDFAKQTVKWVNKSMPELRIECGNILDLNYDNCTFDGYYSGGVFEHFFEGPQNAIAEAYRVLKHQGILISSTPFMNSLRKLKANRFFQCYGTQLPIGMDFYQYLFTRETWAAYYHQAGFNIIKTYFLAGYAGLYHEITVLKKLDDAGLIPNRICRFIDNSILSRLTGHSVLFVLRKE